MKTVFSGVKTDTERIKETINEVVAVIMSESVSSDPVDIEWNYQKNNEWYGEFVIDGKEYTISFVREDLKRGFDKKLVSFKFDRVDQTDPHAYSKDFNKPLVVQATVKEALHDYFSSEKIEVFVIKGYTKEKARIHRYRQMAHTLMRRFRFLVNREFEHGPYTYFILYKKGKKADSEIDHFIKENI